jgi:hypothetical protein
MIDWLRWQYINAVLFHPGFAAILLGFAALTAYRAIQIWRCR